MQNRARALEKSDGNNVHLRATRADTRPSGGKGLEPHPGGEETNELPLTLLAPTGRPWETGPGDPGGDGPRSHLPRGQGSQQTCGGMAVIDQGGRSPSSARLGAPWRPVTYKRFCAKCPRVSGFVECSRGPAVEATPISRQGWLPSLVKPSLSET